MDRMMLMMLAVEGVKIRTRDCGDVSKNKKREKKIWVARGSVFLEASG